MATFVLVHGSWHGGWCWFKVVARLEAAGHRVHAPDLLSLGRDQTPVETVTLEGWVNQIVDVVSRATEPVILVGHSRGGIITSEVCERVPEKVRRAIYLAAFLPQDGQTLLGLARQNANSLLTGALDIDVARNASTVKRDVVAPAFYGGCSADDIALAHSLLRPEAAEPMNATLHVTPDRFGRVPRSYVECTLDRAIDIDLQRQMHAAWPGTTVRTLQTDHSPFLCAPDDLCTLLTEHAG